MERIRRARQPVHVDTTDIEDTEDGEPSYTRREDETAQEAQDRIEAKYRQRATSPLRAIRAFCVLCMGAQPKEVARCTATTCALYEFRSGKNPYQKHKKGE